MAEEKKPPNEELTSAGQRRVNIIWEITQSIIAFLVTGTGMYVAAILSLRFEMKAKRA